MERPRTYYDKLAREARKRPVDLQSYYRKLAKRSRAFTVNLAEKQWSDMHHEHFDENWMGNESRLARVRHLNAHLRALRQARLELLHEQMPYQLFAWLDLKESQNSAVYIHTPNPNGSEFPFDMQCQDEEVATPHILTSRVDRRLYRVLKSRDPGSSQYFVVPRMCE